jgi:hypothetical protein
MQDRGSQLRRQRSGLPSSILDSPSSTLHFSFSLLIKLRRVFDLLDSADAQIDVSRGHSVE